MIADRREEISTDLARAQVQAAAVARRRGIGRWQPVVQGVLYLGLLLTIAGGVLGLAWQSPQPEVLTIGQTDALYVDHIFSPESGPQGPFRWTRDYSRLKFPGVGTGPWHIRLRFATLRPSTFPTPTVELRDVTGQQVFAHWTPSPDFATYESTVPPEAGSAGDLVLQLSTAPTWAVPDGRAVGVMLTTVTLTPLGLRLPAPVDWLRLVASVGLIGLALMALGGPRLVFGGGLALTGVLAALLAWERLWLTPYTGQVLILSATLAGGMHGTRLILRRIVYAPWRIPALRPVLASTLYLVLLVTSLPAFAVGVQFAFAQDRAVDFQAMWQAAGRLDRGQPVYDLAGLRANPFASYYKYPPLFAGLIRLLGAVEFDTARPLWRGVLVAFLLVAVAALIALLTARTAPAVRGGPRAWVSIFLAPAPVALLALVAHFHPVVDAVNYGQLDPLILLLCVLTLGALRASRPGWAGISLALAAALKLYPGLLLLYLVWRREWRAVGSFLAALVGWSLLGVALTTPADALTYITQVLPRSGGTTAWIENQTLSGFVVRLLSDSLALAPLPADPLRDGCLAVAAVAVLGITLWAARYPALRGSMSYALGFAALLSASLFILPVAWLHYLVVLLLALAVAGYAVQQEGAAWWAAAPRPTLCAVVLIGGGGLLLAWNNMWDVYNKLNYGGLWKLILSYKLYGELALWIGLLILLYLTHAVQSATSGQPAAKSAIPPG